MRDDTYKAESTPLPRERSQARTTSGPGAETNFAPPPERRDLPLFDLSLPKSGKTATREEPRAEEKPRPLAWYEETVAAFLANERQKGVDV